MSVPSVPRISPRPKATSGQLEFWWSVPLTGTPITGYTLACPALSISNSYGPDATYAAVGSIPNKTDCTFTITATNANGTGPAATFRTVQCGTPPYSNSVATISATVVSTTVAQVSWTASTTTTQAATKWYVINAIPSNYPTLPIIVKSARGTDTSRVLTNISTSVSYQFLINAVNDVAWARPGLYTSSMTVATPFSPTQISGLQIWLDATASSNFTFSSGSNISSWLDRSGKSQNTSNVAGNMVYSTISGTQAVYTGSAANQLKCGTSTFTLTNASTFTAMGMVNYTNGAATGLANVLSWGNSQELRLYTTGNGSNTMGYATNANDFTLNYFVNGTTSTNAAPKYITLNTPFQFFGINQAATLTASMTLSDPAFGRGWIGYYNEVLFYSGALTTIQRQVLEGYLGWKWGRQGDLPVGHPYKNSAPYSTSPLA